MLTDTKMYEILWVDDDVFDIRMLLYPLEKKGCHVQAVANLPEAYDIISRNRNLDLIVLDLLMPRTDKYGEIPEWLSDERSDGANGIRLLEQIRNNFNLKTPVLILSVVPDAISEMNIQKYSPVEFVHKSPTQIPTVIDKIIEVLKQDRE